MEIPDFDQIARDILVCNYHDNDVAEIAEVVRQVWNARGSADLSELERVLLKLGPPPPDDGTFQESTLGSAIKALDR